MPNRKKTAEEKMLQGTFRKDRDSLHKYKEVKAIPIPPKHYDEYAQGVYYRLAGNLLEKRLLQDTDTDALMLYAYWVGQAHHATVFMESVGFDPTNKDWYKAHLALVKCTEQVNRIGARFGFSPVDKSRVRVEEENTLDINTWLEENVKK